MQDLPLPQILRRYLRALKKAGFYEDHSSGSHIILYKEGRPNPVSVPWHNRDLKRGTLAEIIRQAGLTEKSFWIYCSSRWHISDSPSRQLR
ncbi:MAG: type II toxin-antitoxin system HicA family toxin [Anaerolineae bacterium]